MKLLGHIYVAIKAFPKRNKKLLAFGSLLPETVFYTKNPALTYEQVHEGGLELYKFCKGNGIDYADLAIGTMTHSYKYGVDKYNSVEDIKKLGYQKSDIPKIADALEINEKTAMVRAHNLYDLALDYYVYHKHPGVLRDVEATKSIDINDVSEVLANCYQESKQQIKKNLEDLWDKYDLSLIASFEGLARFWRILAKDLKESDPTNIKKTAILLENFYFRLEPKADNFIAEVIDDTRKRVTAAIELV